jgi:hypothetical protein
VPSFRVSSWSILRHRSLSRTTTSEDEVKAGSGVMDHNLSYHPSERRLEVPRSLGAKSDLESAARSLFVESDQITEVCRLHPPTRCIGPVG